MRDDTDADLDPRVLDGIGPALSRLRRHAPGGRKDFSRNLVLNVVAESESEVSVGAIADQLHIDASVASRMISDSIADGLLARAASQTDARRTVLLITPAGQELRSQFAREQKEAFERITQDWSQEDRLTFARLLIRYADASADYRSSTAAIASSRR